MKIYFVSLVLTSLLLFAYLYSAACVNDEVDT